MKMILLSIVTLFLTTGALASTQCSSEDDLDWGSYGYFQTCRTQHIKQALQENVRCKPSATIVQLPLPNNTDIQQMTPTFVEILQCSGACHGGNKECVATRTREKKVPVMLARCGISTGKCEKECASITVLEHVECGCDCDHVTRDTCPASSHVYDSDTCSCSCADTAAKQQCLDQGRTWSEDQCSCQCSESDQVCSVGLVWSNVTCACVNLESVVSINTINSDQRLPRGTLDTFLSWQLLTIIILLVLVFILIATIFALIAKLQTAKRRLKTAKIQASVRSNDNNEYDLYAEQPQTRVSKDVIVKSKNVKNPDKIYSEVYCDTQTAATGVVYCESPSSGFGSEASKYSTNDLHADTAGCPGPSAADPDNIYHSAHTVRLNKKIQNIQQQQQQQQQPVCSTPQQRLYLPHQEPIYVSKQQQQQQQLYTPQQQHRAFSPQQQCSGLYSPIPQQQQQCFNNTSDPIDEAVRLLEHSAAMLQ